jgi:hypothetical protein
MSSNHMGFSLCASLRIPLFFRVFHHYSHARNLYVKRLNSYQILVLFIFVS